MLAARLGRLAPAGRWWPYDDPFEIAVSAVLTQRARWEGAERAMANLRAEELLTPRALANARRRKVEACVRTAGFYRQKAAALQGMAARISDGFGGRMTKLFELSTEALRAELLAWRGVGDETADAILLYAAGRPTFVVDAYTVRLMRRFGALGGGAVPSYGQVAAAWRAAGVVDVVGSRALHASVVELCKSHCGKVPLCATCPLSRDCPRVGVR